MTYRRVKNVAWRRIAEETVIVNLARQRMLAVNEAGGTVWDTLAAGTAVAAGEAASFLAELEAEGIIERLAVDTAGVPVAVPPGATPTVLWREDLHHFGGGCAFQPGVSDLCNSNPQFS